MASADLQRKGVISDFSSFKEINSNQLLEEINLFWKKFCVDHKMQFFYIKSYQAESTSLASADLQRKAVISLNELKSEITPFLWRSAKAKLLLAVW